MKQKTILVITDGIGYNPSDKFNAFAAAKKPTYEWLFKNTPNSLLRTSGLAVGLPDGQMGNSEVGHMCIGSGRVLYQNLVKIDKAIESGELVKNDKLKELFKKCKTIHVIGLYSDGGVHSHLRHFDAVCDIAQNAGCKVYAHAITDGRDVSPTSGAKFIKDLEAKFSVATVCGRFYAMDRDKRWERVKVAYDVIKNGENRTGLKPSEYVEQSYAKDITDEFIKPASFGEFSGIKKDDGVVFINFRNDRARELVSALSVSEFDGFERDEVVENLVTMTNYDDKFSFDVLFANDDIKETLSDIVSKAGLTQLHTAETEKYAHVTFFFNGGKEEPKLNETRVLIPSPKVKTYDEMPQMSAYEVCDAVIKGVEFGHDFIVVNFANGDMVGHTGNFDAAVRAVEAVDECLSRIIKVAKENNYAYIQISDHGNCEAMQSESEGMLTNHTTFDVFCFVMADGVSKVANGGLSNVAPSVLKLMGLEIPEIMDKPLF
ncbi:2,3-bisphosphoglycerate-independent phosphoglycerate mutase [Campylobacter geochelonis]|uniref:2,3-bisphosphoglycerate-independent phosphoglycerate mutase n=1 Tax=Campylobacter geochelonis TaxID=1780362 RepID=A0A128EG74_9BACT|nr:2,3-bisphosphoglycerate-independent phosphoglycerate mutase [Campylobacter geochelonis]QKF71914.1 phosphoglycerate mutase [Campylobacter geochelonis]CZE47884.1 phosphoglyceromutase [Campylobacter geochelonis]CZE51026.1 phosphoglyceromutase [Campylobacter geochelonis]